MKNNLAQRQILEQVEIVLGIHILEVRLPMQGMDSEVFLVTDEGGHEYIVKFGMDVFNDFLALNLIQENKIEIPTPLIHGHFSFENKTVLILEKITHPLLEFAPHDTQYKYIESMLDNLNKIHLIKSDKAGLLSDQQNKKTWKELLLFKYSGEHPWFDWKNISRRDGVDGKLLEASLKKIIKKIENQDFLDKSYSLLHTDFNQRNIFVDPTSNKVAGIIDWSEAMFGDLLYDFARIRMYIWHFNLKHNALQNYYRSLALTDKEKTLEELYMVSQILDYVTWYSEVKNDFNDARLGLHQQFLRDYNW